MSKTIFRVHPAIGIARVGNSEEYYLAPESIAALPQPGKPEDKTTGGLPLDPDTGEVIKSSQLRDQQGAFKRQAARFRVFAYSDLDKPSYPEQGAEQEVTIGSQIQGKTVKNIKWCVHLANKKSAWFVNDDDHGVVAYENGNFPVLRNLPEGLDPYNESRLRRLVIDAGPRVVDQNSDLAQFDSKSHTQAAYLKGTETVSVADYPFSFPYMHFDHLDIPKKGEDTKRCTGKPLQKSREARGITSLGNMLTDSCGRLIVAGGYGKAVGWRLDNKDNPVPIDGPVNNDQWFDDTSDGPVTAVIEFEDGSCEEVFGGWVVVTDPSYAPQTLNVVSLFDEAYDTFVRKLNLQPDVFCNGRFNPEYKPAFDDHIRPIFKATGQQLWNAYLPEIAIQAHKSVDEITASDDPDTTILAGLAYIRQPNPGTEATWRSQSIDEGAPLMPLSLGDSSEAGGKPFLTPTVTQYQFLHSWSNHNYVDSNAQKLGEGEYLDRATLQNCLGGRFSPGIDMTWIIRETAMYQDWQTGAGPFRIKHKLLNYAAINNANTAFLGLGWIPRHEDVEHLGLEPGDATKFMALPWHADYNSCAIHQTSPNDLNSETLYWSWPAQRPVTVYVAHDYDINAKDLPAQRYSVRGKGTYPLENTPTDKHDLANAGRFWEYREMLTKWDDIGVVVQGTVIDDGREYSEHVYLEVESMLHGDEPELAAPKPWPLLGGSGTATRKK
ncbi:LodA/GoxA family CTQ-dependent oxidase [Pseudoalteromonas luteoviolacea]|uniref:LodA/GoxA family CTQ-dependent oxidase n=1 Tax=Pseudoalteromonas luteoviolacea TaxID=43657 RepID=UPI001B3891C4|nr:LodA/GoxA family CTQ-dependent oxidase [Pseudoalteromonas luteoviolacea]MBQ4835179.1 LodA/GoxA family CTQ-dependent oxidase [Pseudoalteromonas luteoviolacea]